jgi:peptidyl-prolyl cis-trans isomerase B (cyclophilin B)
MRKNIYKILILILALFVVAGCGKKGNEGNKVVEEIKEGTIEGYHFKQVDEPTDRVKIQMENGDIILVVLSNKDTPITIANFKKLVSEKFYDGIIFHRIISDFMIQAGDPTGTGYYGSDEKIKGEFSANGVKNGLSHTAGVISMARGGSDMNSASSQFFIMASDTHTASLDGNYAAFGKVFAGMNVVEKLSVVETDENDKPLQDQRIQSIRFIEIIRD